MMVERAALLGDRQSTALSIARGGRQLCAKAIWHTVYHRSRKRFGRGYGVHIFRYSIATDGMRSGEAAFEDASPRLGHSSLNMSMRYVHPSAITEVSKRHTETIDDLTGEGPVDAGTRVSRG